MFIGSWLDAVRLAQFSPQIQQRLMVRARVVRAAGAPNHFKTVKDLNKARPELLRHNSFGSCAEFLQLLLQQLPVSEGWGHLSKSSGETGYTFPNNIRVSHDVIYSNVYRRQVDVIYGGGGHPTPGGPAWDEIDPSLYRPGNQWVAPFPGVWDSDAPNDIEVIRALLGRGWFCFLRAQQDWPSELEQNWKWLLDNENPDFFRVFLNLEGLRHVGTIGIDVWRDAGVNPWWPWWSDGVKKMLDRFGVAGKKALLTLHGGREYVLTNDLIRRFNDQLVKACDGRWNSVLICEGANEYKVNGWTEDSVRAVTRDLWSKVPSGTIIAISSPDLAHNGEPTNEEMLQSMEALYGGDGAGANFMTIHRNRDARSKWYSPFSYNPFMQNFVKGDNEPSGQAASAGGDVNTPGILINQYVMASEAGWKNHVAHCAWSVWNGHLPKEWIAHLKFVGGDFYGEQHAKHFVWEQANMTAVSQGLREYRKSGIVIAPDPKPEPEPEDDLVLPDRNRVYNFMLRMDAYYKSPEGLQRPLGMIVPRSDGQPQADFEGLAAWVFDVYMQNASRGMSDDDCFELCVDGIEQSAEWKAKHPNG